MDIVGKTIQNGEPSPEHPVDIENKINLTGAIQILNKLKSKVTLVKVDDENNLEKEYRLPFLMNIEQQAIETVLSELEKKDRVINEIKKEVREHIGFERRLIRENIEPDLFNQGRFYVANEINNILKVEKEGK